MVCVGAGRRIARKKGRGIDEGIVRNTIELTGWSLITRSWYNVGGKKDLFSYYMRSGTETRFTW